MGEFCEAWGEGERDEACADADLTVRGRWSVDDCSADRVVLLADVANRGTASAPAGVEVAFTRNDYRTDPVCVTTTTESIAPGASVPVSCEWLRPGSERTLTVYVEADPGDDVTECSGDNNRSTILPWSCDALFDPEPSGGVARTYEECPWWDPPGAGQCCDVYGNAEGCPCGLAALVEPYDCDYGPPHWGRGRCGGGITYCRGGVWAACEGGRGPMRERPNGADDDCDGLDDDGLCAPEEECTGHCCTDEEACLGSRCEVPAPCTESSDCFGDDTHCVAAECIRWGDGESDPACPEANLTVWLTWVLDECTESLVVLRALVSNRGSQNAPAGIGVDFYANNGPDYGDPMVCQAATTRELAPGETEEVVCDWSNPRADYYYYSLVAQVDPDDAVPECVEAENRAFLPPWACNALYHPEHI